MGLRITPNRRGKVEVNLHNLNLDCSERSTSRSVSIIPRKETSVQNALSSVGLVRNAGSNAMCFREIGLQGNQLPREIRSTELKLGWRRKCGAYRKCETDKARNLKLIFTASRVSFVSAPAAAGSNGW